MGIKVCNIRLDKQHLETDLKTLNLFLDTVNVKLTSAHFVSTATKDYWSVLIFYDRLETKAATRENDLSQTEEATYNLLKNWRNSKAAELNLKPYMISYNSELITIALNKPKTLTELRGIKGFGDVKVSKYGQEILSLLNSQQ